MNTPTKNKTAYYYFSRHIRKTTEIKSIKDKSLVNKTIRQKWKLVEDKKEWEVLAKKDLDRYLSEKESWDKHISEREVSEKIQCKVGNIELGLCCLNNTLKDSKPKIFPNRTCVLKTALTKGIEHTQQLALKNLKDVLKMIDWNYEHGITSYRLSSNMFPHSTNEKFFGGYSLDFANDLLQQIGSKAKEYDMRLSMHPGHFNHIGAKNEKVFQNTIVDLSHHADILERIEHSIDFGSKKAILCVHGGGTYGNKKETIQRWISNFKRLPKNVQDRICLENCEKSYSSQDCLYISKQLKIPHIFDIHHYYCYDLYHKTEKQPNLNELIPSILLSWNSRSLKPYFHISEQGEGPVGKHSEYIETIPKDILNIKQEITLDVEAKGKEKAIFYLAKKYTK